MKELRLTKARIVEIINYYRGMYTGVADELKKGGIDTDRPYTQKRDPATGDYIYMQDEIVDVMGTPDGIDGSTIFPNEEEVVEEVKMPMSIKGLSKKKKKQAKKSKKGKK